MANYNMTGPGPGRPKGSKDKRSYMLEELLAQKKEYAHLFEEGVFTGSACFWAEVMQDVTNPLPLRLKAAESLAKYLNYAKPILTETSISSDDEGGSFTITLLKNKPDPKE